MVSHIPRRWRRECGHLALISYEPGVVHAGTYLGEDQKVYQISMPFGDGLIQEALSSVLVSEARRAGWKGGLVLQGRGLEEPGRCSQAYH